MVDRPIAPPIWIPFFIDDPDNNISQEWEDYFAQVSDFQGTLSENLLVETDADGNLASVSDLTVYIAGTTDKITVSDDGDGSVTITIPDTYLPNSIIGTDDEIDVTDNGNGTVTIGLIDPLIVGKGGSGLATLTDGAFQMGAGTSPVEQLGPGTDGQLPIGSTGNTAVLSTITAGDGIDIANGSGSIQIDTDLKANGGIVIESNELAVDLGASNITGILAPTDGGTGISEPTDHSLLVGSGAGAMTELGVATDGQLPIGSTGADPVLATLTETADEIDIANAAGSITLSISDQFLYNNIFSIIQDFTGFSTPEDVIVTGDSATRTVTLTGTVNAYYQGELNTTIINGWTSGAHSATTTTGYFLLYDGATIDWVALGDLDETDFYTGLLIAIAFYDNTNSTWIYQRECHSFMPWETHRQEHRLDGTYRQSGGALQDYTLNSTTAADRRPSVEATLLYDEDLPTLSPVLNSSLYSNFYLTGAASDVVVNVDQADIVPLSGNRPYWNEFTGGAWQQTLMSNNYYMAIWVLCVPVASDTPSQQWRYLFIQGQTEDNSLGNIQALTPQDVSIGVLGGLLPELIVTNKIIIQYTAGNWKFIEVSEITGTSSSQTTSPSGNYLTSVTSDATLDGLGTPSSPLGVNVGIADDDILQVDDAAATDNDYAKFTANGIEGRTYAEVRTDINVADGADVTGDNAPQAHAASHTDGSDDIQDATAAQKGLATATQITKLDGIEALAEVNNISDADATDLTDGGDTTLHDHDGISENTAARHTQGTDTTLGTMTADIDMDSSYQVVNLQAPAALAEAIRQTANVTETNLNELTGGGDTTLHDHDGISENTAARHTQGTDTTLGTMTDDVDMGGYYITAQQNLLDIASKGAGYWYDGVDDYINLDSLAAELVSTSNTVGYVHFRGKIHDFATNSLRYWYFGDTNANERIGMYNNSTDGRLSGICVVAGSNKWVFFSSTVFEEGVIYDIFLIHNGTTPLLYVNGKAESLTFNVSTDLTAWFSDTTGIDNGRLGTGSYTNQGNLFFGNITTYSFSVGNIALDNTDPVDQAILNGAPMPFKYIGANNTEQTSGTLTIGKAYRINDWISDDDFTNVGGTNADGSEFVATGTTPTKWTNSSTVVPIGAIIQLEQDNVTDTVWYDKSGNALDGAVTGAAVTNPSGPITQTSAVVAEVDETKFSHKLPVTINGTSYYLMMTTT